MFSFISFIQKEKPRKNQQRTNSQIKRSLFSNKCTKKNQKNIFKNLSKHKLFFHQFFKILVYTIKNNFCLKIITNDKIMLLHTCSLILHSHTHTSFPHFPQSKIPFLHIQTKTTILIWGNSVEFFFIKH